MLPESRVALLASPRRGHYLAGLALVSGMTKREKLTLIFEEAELRSVQHKHRESEREVLEFRSERPSTAITTTASSTARLERISGGKTTRRP